MVRLDCNAVQRSGHDSEPAIKRLLGVAPGFVCYASGQGGIPSRIRDLPGVRGALGRVRGAGAGASRGTG